MADKELKSLIAFHLHLMLHFCDMTYKLPVHLLSHNEGNVMSCHTVDQLPEFIQTTLYEASVTRTHEMIL